MTTKRAQRRFTNEREIHAEINSGLRRKAALSQEADNKEQKGHTYVRTGDPGLVESGKQLVEEADHIRRTSIARLETRLEKLKRALSSFKTEMLPGMGSDNAVVLENLKK